MEKKGYEYRILPRNCMESAFLTGFYGLSVYGVGINYEILGMAKFMMVQPIARLRRKHGLTSTRGFQSHI
jgi:hypothetical protein